LWRPQRSQRSRRPRGHLSAGRPAGRLGGFHASWHHSRPPTAKCSHGVHRRPQPHGAFVSAADGSGVRPVSVPGPVNDRLWAIAPDGSQVLILRGGVGGGLILATTRGTEWRFVTQDEWSNLLRLWRAYPWSPDGRFQVYAEGSTLLVVPAEGGPARRIATAGTLWNESPIWSPDGEWIAFDGFIDTDGWTHAELYVVRADGSALRRLTKAATSENRRGRRTGRSSHSVSMRRTST
jgi:hypothetical protein